MELEGCVGPSLILAVDVVLKQLLPRPGPVRAYGVDLPLATKGWSIGSGIMELMFILRTKEADWSNLRIRGFVHY
eukprot:3666063-Rhodomonas_salina.1